MQFQITNVMAWAYNNADPASLLQDLATRAVVHYLAGVDLNEVMSHGAAGGGAGRCAIKFRPPPTRHQLGVKILFVGLQDIHPPVKVAADYEKVVGAEQTKLAAILSAQADAIRTNALAGRAGVHDHQRRRSHAAAAEVSALARAALFTNQIPAFAAAPSVYRQRAYFQTFADATANARKYILLVTNTQDVVIFNLEDKIREDLLNLNVPASTNNSRHETQRMTIVIGAVLVVIFALLLFVFQVRQSEVAVVTTFGKPTAQPTTSPAPISNGRGPSRRFTNSTSASRISRTSSARHSRRTTTTSRRRLCRLEDFRRENVFPEIRRRSVTAAQRILEGMLRSAKSARHRPA